MYFFDFKPRLYKTWLFVNNNVICFTSFLVKGRNTSCSYYCRQSVSPLGKLILKMLSKNSVSLYYCYMYFIF